MKIYLAVIHQNDYDGQILGVCRERSLAIKKVQEYMSRKYSADSIKKFREDFGGDFDKGEIFTEEEITEIYEKELE